MSTEISIFNSKEKETAYMAAYDEAVDARAANGNRSGLWHFVPQEQPEFVNSRILEVLAEG